jgi:hypothetical protein
MGIYIGILAEYGLLRVITQTNQHGERTRLQQGILYYGRCF